MKGFLEYKGYQGSVEYNDDDQVFFGKVMYVKPLLSYEGTDVKSLRRAFRDAVDDYLALCRQQGRKPDQPFKGTFNVRTGSELHRRLVTYASEHNTNLNSVVMKAVESFLAEH
jgi:predicted HicB family RNase H-like nuclease